MTEQSTEQDYPIHAVDVPLERCEVQLLFNVNNVENLDEALAVAALDLIRYGLDAFYILATDPDTGEQWVVHNGEVTDREHAVARLEKVRDDLEKALSGDGESDDEAENEDE